MADSGAATAIAKWIERSLGSRHAILTVVLACGILTYGGVSLFVVAFAIYPIAKSLFRDADIPKRLVAPAIALGSFTFTMTALPGTPSIQNAIPIKYFGTNTFSAPGLGLIGGAIMFTLGILWLRARRPRAPPARAMASTTTTMPACAPWWATPAAPCRSCWRCCRWCW